MKNEVEEVETLIPEEIVKPKKKNVLLVVLLAFFITVPTIPFLLYRYAINNSPATNSEVEIEIDQGQGVSEIAQNLHDAGLINSTLLFKIYVKINDLDTNIQAGNYTVPPRTSLVALTNILQYGRNDVTIRFVEGWRLEQLGLLLEEELTDFDYTEFMKLSKGYEGQLFADTYYINKDATEQEVFEILRSTFDEKTKDLLSDSNLNAAELTRKEAIVMASILEREAYKENDRKLIAGILMKRLREGMRLEVDATTQYAIALEAHCLGDCRFTGDLCQAEQETALCLTGEYSQYIKDVDWWPSTLTKYDLDLDSPYNTRKNYGIPPTPISSFSLNSLEAVINSEPSNFYFYLTDPSGVTHFSVTYDEHLAKSNRYLN